MSEVIERLREFKKQAGMTYHRNGEGALIPISPMSDARAQFLFPLYRSQEPSKTVLKMRAEVDRILSGKCAPEK